jgi:hypothetical protein
MRKIQGSAWMWVNLQILQINLKFLSKFNTCICILQVYLQVSVKTCRYYLKFDKKSTPVSVQSPREIYPK